MAQVLLQQATEGGESDDDDDASSAESSVHLDQLKDSYQDAQDPYADLSDEDFKSTKSRSKGCRQKKPNDSTL